MDRTELIELLTNTFKSVDQDYKAPILVNFVDDEIHWDTIATLAIETITNCFDEVPWEQQ